MIYDVLLKILNTSPDNEQTVYRCVCVCVVGGWGVTVRLEEACPKVLDNTNVTRLITIKKIFLNIHY